MPTIVSITPKGQWQEFHKFEVRFDNNDFGLAFAKTPTPSYNVGDDVQYTKNEKGTLKIQRNGWSGGNGGSFANTSKVSGDERSASIIRQVALKAAVEYGAAAGHDVQAILANAETFNEWMSGNQPKTPTYDQHFQTRDESPF